MINTYIISDKNKYAVLEYGEVVYKCAKIVGWCIRRDMLLTIRKDATQLLYDDTIPCGKIRLTESEAESRLEAIRNGLQPDTRREIRSYWCDRCQATHLTSKETFKL